MADTESQAVEPAPCMGLAVDAAYLKGMARQADGFVMILDLDRIFSAEALAPLPGQGTDASPAASQ